MTPLQLRAIAAATEGDGAALDRLCTRNAAPIVAEFDAWARVPEEFRGDQEAAQWYVQLVLHVARLLDGLGHPGPLERLTGGSENPIVRWQRALSQARVLSDAGERDRAAGLLESVLGEMAGSSGTAVDDLRPKVTGTLGTVRFHQGDLAAARVHLAAALAECRAQGDGEGVRVYSENLSVLDALELPPDPVREAVLRAQELSDALRHRAGTELLLAVVPGLDEGHPLRAKVYGLLGLTLHRTGDPEGARRWTGRALDACRVAGDENGVTIYSENLAAIDRAAAAPGGSPGRREQ